MNKKKHWKTFGASSIFAVGIMTSLTQPSSAAITVKIACKTNTSVPTVIATLAAQGSAKDVPILSFLPQYFSSQSAVQSCQDTAKTLQVLYSQDNANYLTADKLSTGSAVCAVERRGIGCNHASAQVLFTLSPTANPSQALYEMLGRDFKQPQPPDARTVSRIYSDIKPRRGHWWFF